MRRFPLLYVGPTLLLLLVGVWPLVNGEQTLFMRDVFNSHLPMKWAQAEAMKEGRIPLVADYRSGGQAHVGNPNTVPLYPDNVLYLFLPFFWVFNAHFWMHWLIAPFAMYWLGREWGLGRRAAWTSGVMYALCGYYLSNYNFYNLVAGVTLAPALAAALLRIGRREGIRLGFAATAVLWCLLLLSGGPIVAALAAAFGGLSMLAMGEAPRRLRYGLGAGLLGTVVAAPQLVEFLRILPLTFRGLFGYSVDSVLKASWNPRSVLDWLLPFPYGTPSFDFWGPHLFGDELPFYFSFYPGVVAIVLFAWCGLPRTRPARFAWGWMLAGLFFALGSHNPVLVALLETTGIQLVRFPVKFWLWVALGGSLLCGLGVERWVSGSERRTGQFALAPILLAAAAWGAVFWVRSESALTALRGWIPERFDQSLVDAERIRWAGLLLIAASLLTIVAALVWLGDRRESRSVPLAMILALHVVTQLVVLRPLLPMDEVAFYESPPKVLAEIPPGSRVVHGATGSLFGPARIDPKDYPDASFRWLQRQTFSELYPAAGILAGASYELVLSPEGLDSFRTRLAKDAIQRLPDPERVRLLEGWGIEYLIIDRELDLPEEMETGRLERIATFENSLGRELEILRFLRPQPSARFVGRVVPQSEVTDELRILADATHDPGLMVVVPAGSPRAYGPAGTLEVLADEPEHFRGRVRSSSGGAIVLQRTLLPIYRATVGGESVEPIEGDLHRMTVPVPPGEHEVVVEVDRRPWRVAWIVALLGLIELGLVWRRLGAPA